MLLSTLVGAIGIVLMTFDGPHEKVLAYILFVTFVGEYIGLFGFVLFIIILLFVLFNYLNTLSSCDHAAS